MLQYIVLETLTSNKCSCLMWAFISYKENEVLWTRTLVPYSQYFIYIITNEWAQWTRLLHYPLERLTIDKHSSITYPFVTKWSICKHCPRSCIFISFSLQLTNGPKKLDCLSFGRPIYLFVWNKLIGPICKLWWKWSVVNTFPGIVFATFHFLQNLWMGPIS